jgi:cell wall-associated NlpC family hydrolase
MTLREQIVEEARTWIDTPFHHQARIKGVGVDCVGLVLGVGKKFGLFDKDFDVRGYAKVPDGRSLMGIAETVMRRITYEEMQPGDVIMLRFSRDPQHVGIIGNYRHGGLSIIHAAGGGAENRVVETRLLLSSAMDFVAAFSLIKD